MQVTLHRACSIAQLKRDGGMLSWLNRFRFQAFVPMAQTGTGLVLFHDPNVNRFPGAEVDFVMLVDQFTGYN